MPYKYAVYNMQDEQRTQASNRLIEAMEADGWKVHTVNCTFAELCIFWEKPAVPKDDKADRDKGVTDEDKGTQRSRHARKSAADEDKGE